MAATRHWLRNKRFQAFLLVIFLTTSSRPLKTAILYINFHIASILLHVFLFFATTFMFFTILEEQMLGLRYEQYIPIPQAQKISRRTSVTFVLPDFNAPDPKKTLIAPPQRRKPNLQKQRAIEAQPWWKTELPKQCIPEAPQRLSAEVPQRHIREVELPLIPEVSRSFISETPQRRIPLLRNTKSMQHLKPALKHTMTSTSTESLKIHSDPGPSTKTPAWDLFDIPEQPTSVSDAVQDKDDDDMTLAQRRDQIIRRRTSLSHMSSSQRPVLQKKLSLASLSSSKLERRDSKFDALKNESRFAKWRESIQHTQAPECHRRAIDEAMMTAMHQDRREAELEKQQREREKAAQEQLMDARMRSQPMLESHRRAMSQMQGRVANC